MYVCGSLHHADAVHCGGKPEQAKGVVATADYTQRKCIRVFMCGGQL